MPPISSGTWSLMGFESKTPYVSEEAMAANITNEGGAEGRYRVLKNIMGLWLLQRVLKENYRSARAYRRHRKAQSLYVPDSSQRRSLYQSGA
jgi:sugar (pentulose or hexulose) kinase